MSMITKDDVLAILPTLDKRRKNPTYVYDSVYEVEDMACLYTDPKKPERHCIAGEILVRLGHGNLLPTIEHEQALAAERNLPPVRRIVDGQDFSLQAVGLLGELQETADGLRHDGKPVVWGEAIKMVLADQE